MKLGARRAPPVPEMDISTVIWDQVAAFPMEVGGIKPAMSPSPVFTSKFCHFLLPKVFPVVDEEGLGNRWSTYEGYFKFVQAVWKTTDLADQGRLEAALSRLIESAGQRFSPQFPMKNKIVERRLMGRHHPAWPRGVPRPRRRLSPRHERRRLARGSDGPTKDIVAGSV